MKNLMVFFILALVSVACGQASSRGDNIGDGTYWLLKDSRAQYCIETLKRQGLIGYNQPVALYPDNVNIFAIRQANPQSYSSTETEFKNMCRSVGIDLDYQEPDSEPRT